MHRIVTGLLAALFATLTVWPAGVLAQAADARALYYQRADPELDEADAWLGVRTSILLASSDRRRARMRVREVGDQERFRTGDRFRLAVQANVEDYLYVFVKDSEGEIELLFPYERGEDEDERFRARDIDRSLEDAGDNEWKLFDEPDDDGEMLRTYYVELPESRRSYLVRAFDLEHR